ncbi:hypothetical protein EST38_g1051 [Candolleomyces aberdarensis]|uniref:RNA-dependent RNA polymerase n=1 Tax=Candolleomyces aberdarensis TaxID=2316362 RepID=A0A4Q2DWP1_9AGAR|nr:hypothetical protein EST38_g1051 [Candolleomyces aberdarensis]
MEIFMKGVSWNATRTEVVLSFVDHLHSPSFLGSGTTPINFHVFLFKDKRGFRPHSGSGVLTFATSELGSHFLSIYGPSGKSFISVKGMPIQFTPGRNQPGRPDVLEMVKRLPYVDPRIQEEESRRSKEIAGREVAIRTIQFGWDCRDGVFSAESEVSPSDCSLAFDEEQRQFRVQYSHTNSKYIIAIRFSQIDSLTAHHYLHSEPVILFILLDPPIYEMEPQSTTPDYNGTFESLFSRLFLDSAQKPLRSRLSALPIPPDHERVAPYASLALRLVCASNGEVEKFRSLSKLAGFPHVGSHEYPFVRRNLFSQDAVDEYNQWVRKLPWAVAFQVESIVRKRSVDLREMLELLPDIKQLTRRTDKDKAWVSSLLRDFGTKVHSLYISDSPEDRASDAVRRCFDNVVKSFESQPQRRNFKPTDGSLCEALHVTITPTTMMLDGPYPERSNRVIRKYDPVHQESFIRVTFAEEGRLQYRFDREINSQEFIKSRVGPILLHGLVIAERKFEFLAYSQSALKEHSVWYVFEFG